MLRPNVNTQWPSMSWNQIPPDKSQLYFIIEFGKMTFNVAGSLGNHIKQLFRHTAVNINHTSSGIISLSTPFTQKLCATSEKEFGKFIKDQMAAV